MTRWNSNRDKIGAVSADITAETNALPAGYSTDSEVHKMEREEVFGRYWVYADHETRVPDAGDYFMRTIGDKQMIVTRDGEDDVWAFYNACAHRGSKMLDNTPMTDLGSPSRIICPYHLWVYEPDGSLQSIPKSFEEVSLNPDLDDDAVSELDPKENGLMEVNADAVGPLVFVNFEDEPSLSLAEQVREMKAELEDLLLGEHEHTRRYVSEVECNRKTFSGDYSECDYCQVNHQDWVQELEFMESELEVNDYHQVLHYKHKEDVDDEMRIHLEHEAKFYCFWPNFTANMYGTADGYGTYIIDPVDEGRFQLIVDYYFRDSELSEGEEKFVQTSRQLQEENFGLVERQYEGLTFGALGQAQPGPSEHTVHRLHRLAQGAYNA